MTRTGPRAVVELDELVIAHGETLAVDRATLSVRDGEIAALVGPSGCGKTSLLRAVAGFEQPRSGTVSIDGAAVAGNGCWVPPEKRHVGMVFQQGALFPHMTVDENVRYGVERLPDGESRAAEALERVGLGALGGRYPDQLSGGQQQLAALARALAPSPRLVLLDEPFASLDASLRERLRDEVRAILRTARMTAILVTHDQEEALHLADRVAVMARGSLLQVGTPDEVYHWPVSSEVADFIGGGQLLDCVVSAGRLECALGTIDTDAPDGNARMLVRPEDVRLLPEDSTDGVRGEVVECRFYGHDLLKTVRVSGDALVQARVFSSSPEAARDRLRLRLRRKAFRVFGADGQSAHRAGDASD